MTKSGKVTMAKLARLANVDVSTVSRALNDSPLVKPKTKASILKIAAETGYAVNASARSLRKQSTETIGMVVPLRPGSGQTLSDPFYLEMVGAVAQAASDHGYDLIVSVPRADNEIAERRLLQTGRADGLIVIGQAGRVERLNALGPLAQKVVVWGGQAESSDYTVVGSDNVEGGRLAADHLLSLGRERILFLGDIDLPEVALRYEGVKAAHEARGIHHDTALVLKLDFGAQDTGKLVSHALESGLDFDAVFAASDVLAMAAMQALQSRGKRIPEDISVVGYDNIGQAALSTPALTTIDQNIAEGGRIMVERLLKQLGGEKVGDHLTPTQLIVRESSLN